MYNSRLIGAGALAMLMAAAGTQTGLMPSAELLQASQGGHAYTYTGRTRSRMKGPDVGRAQRFHAKPHGRGKALRAAGLGSLTARQAWYAAHPRKTVDYMLQRVQEAA